MAEECAQAQTNRRHFDFLSWRCGGMRHARDQNYLIVTVTNQLKALVLRLLLEIYTSTLFSSLSTNDLKELWSGFHLWIETKYLGYLNTNY